MKNNNLSIVNEELKQAISQKDKRKILSIYDSIEKEIDLDSADEHDFHLYNELVDSANEILYEESL